MMSKTKLAAACAGLLVGGIAATADAALVLDLRLRGGGTSGDGKLQIVAGGENLIADIFVKVSGQKTGSAEFVDPDTEETLPLFNYAENFQSAMGSVIINNQGLLTPSATVPNRIGRKGGSVGTPSASKVAFAPWDAQGASGGSFNDLNGDGIKELGYSKIIDTGADPAKHITLRAPEPVLGNPDADFSEFHVGAIEIRVGSIDASGRAEINWSPALDASGNVAAAAFLWSEDSMELDPAPGDQVGKFVAGFDGLSSGWSIGTPIVLAVPEPMSMSLLAIGGALIGLRRVRR